MFKRVYVSHNRLEWWYGHLTRALSRDLEVRDYPMMRFNQPGHAPEADLSELITGEAADRAFYMGSPDQLFAGLSRLVPPSAVWVDASVEFTRVLLAALKLYDVVFASQKDGVMLLRHERLPRVEWLPFACDTTLYNDPGAEKVYDIGFVGSVSLPGTRDERLDVLGRLEQRYRLNDYRQPVFGDDMMRIYNQSRIIVNIPWTGGLNMRTFEAMASGALLLTKAANGQDELFKDGTHLVTYRDTADLLDKVAYYLQNDRERNAIAAAGSREVLQHHTYAHRAARVLEVMASASRTRAVDRATHVAAYGWFYDYLGRADLLAGVALDRGVTPRQRGHLLSRAVIKGTRSALAFRKRGGVCTSN